ncbi:hypothetical protein Goari_019515 [Gossypium aridum]|uniref:Uncharacterized protein n=1 Tax=Gossypium aridum TaxID=34290 RepID=A0A7J8WU11_GOSAI|nr:hypothetical protein [Gossypium aridum]
MIFLRNKGGSFILILFLYSRHVLTEKE